MCFLCVFVYVYVCACVGVSVTANMSHVMWIRQVGQIKHSHPIFSWISLLDPTLLIPMEQQQAAQEVAFFCSLGEPDHIIQVRCP